MTVGQIRTILQQVVEAHDTHNNWISVWSEAKDRPSEPDYPFVAWSQWRSRLVEDPMGQLQRKVLVQLVIVTEVATDRTQEQRDLACEAAEDAAAWIIIHLRDQEKWEVSDVSTTTQYDESRSLETGVVLTFSVLTSPICADTEPLPDGDCDPFTININGYPLVDVTSPCGSSIDIPIYDSQGSVIPTTIVDGQVLVDDLPCGSCLMTVKVYVNDVLDQTIDDVDPCEDNTVKISA